MPDDHPHLTARDIENARTRREIAARQTEEHGRVLRWALGAFGPGWLPSHRNFLVARDEEERCRRTGERPAAAATVYTVHHEETFAARHFTVSEDGTMRECASYEEGFGAMLLELHPTRGFEHKGQWCRTHRFSLCWADFSLYHPKTAEQLAALRASRERKKAEREQKRWAAENPLLAWAERSNHAGDAMEQEGPGR